MTVEKLYEEALKLPPLRRLELADRLSRSLDDWDALEAGLEIAEERWRKYQRGEMGAKPMHEVFPELKRKRATRKK